MRPAEFLMTPWFMFALMTAAAIFAVLWPLGRAPRAPAADNSDVAVYRDQLAELDADAASGRLPASEAGAARTEIARRLLAAAAAGTAAPFVSLRARRSVAVAALAGLPLLAAALYLPLGSPGLPDAPLAARAMAAPDQPLQNLVAQVEAHLEKNPDDVRGWNVLAPVLGRLGRSDDAVRAYRRLIALGDDSAERRGDLGEALVAAANGVVTAEAKQEFTGALAKDANGVKARYFLGLAAEQDGRRDEAATIWRAMLATAPADAPWRSGVGAALARLGVGAAPVVGPALSDDTIASAQGMSAGDRTAMIRGMVGRLAGKLRDDGSDVQGWLRLVRAYGVLGDADRATAATADARQALAGNAAKLQEFDAGVKMLGQGG